VIRIRGIPEVWENCCYSKNAFSAQASDKNLHKKWFLLAVLIRNYMMHETYQCVSDVMILFFSKQNSGNIETLSAN